MATAWASWRWRSSPVCWWRRTRASGAVVRSPARSNTPRARAGHLSAGLVPGSRGRRRVLRRDPRRRARQRGGADVPGLGAHPARTGSTRGPRTWQRAVEIDPDYPDARVFRAIVAERGGDYELAAAEIDRFYRNDPSPAAIQVLQIAGAGARDLHLHRRRARPGACWQQAAAARTPTPTDAAAFLEALGDVPGRGARRGPRRCRRAGLTGLHERRCDLDRTWARRWRWPNERSLPDPRTPTPACCGRRSRYAQGRVGEAAGRPGRAGGPATTHGIVPVRGSRGAAATQLEAATAPTTTPQVTSTTSPGATTTSVDDRIPNPAGADLSARRAGPGRRLPDVAAVRVVVATPGVVKRNDASSSATACRPGSERAGQPVDRDEARSPGPGRRGRPGRARR